MAFTVPTLLTPQMSFGGWLLALLLSFLAATPAAAQDRPLRTPDTQTVPAGSLRAQVGFDFLQDIDFPLSGLSGDLTSVAVTDLRMGVGSIVEVQLQGAVQNFLDVKRKVGSFMPQLTGPNSTHDYGDFSLWTKVRIRGEARRLPGVAFRFGFEMPNSNQARGIGTNSTNVYAMVVLEKHFGKLDLFGDLGLGILQSPNAKFSQNDVLLYGAAFRFPIVTRLTLAGEVNGRFSSRKINTDLLGTQSSGQGRLGFQILAAGFRWDVAGIAGINPADAASGFTFGVSRDIHLFHLPAQK